jgi:hypothetical protein
MGKITLLGPLERASFNFTDSEGEECRNLSDNYNHITSSKCVKFALKYNLLAHVHCHQRNLKFKFHR